MIGGAVDKEHDQRSHNKIRCLLQFTLLRTLERHQVTTPLLKFMTEFVLNKVQRLTFASSSPNGIILFHEVSKLIVAYGTRVLNLPTPVDIYTYKYTGIWIFLTIQTSGDFGTID